MDAEHPDLGEDQSCVDTSASNDLSNLSNDPINSLFEKKFVLANNDNYSLPEPDSIFTTDTWELEELQILKKQLNEVKNGLNDFNLSEWNQHTNLTNGAKEVTLRLKKNVQAEFVTVAWCKFYEIASSYPVIPVHLINDDKKFFKSVHLCEAPGAFITSLNHWLKSNAKNVQWDWIATSLNPYYEGNNTRNMNYSDKFIRNTMDHWCFGEDNTGNLMDLKNLDKLKQVSEPNDKTFLVTADGSIDCSDVPAEQENVVAHLQYCETITAIHLLAIGGSFVLKVFTTFECHTVCLIYLLACCFDRINCFKPATSKEGNSEMYVICLDFKGLPKKYLDIFRKHYEMGPIKAMFQKSDIPPKFIKSIIQCSTFFKTHQCLAITRNIMYYGKTNLLDMKRVYKIVADRFIEKYNVKILTAGRIIDELKLKGGLYMNKGPESCSYNERCKKKNLSHQDVLKSLLREADQIQTEIQSTMSITFKITNLPKELQIHTAKLFNKVVSSRFCASSIMKLQTQLDDIILEAGYKIDFPAAESLLQTQNDVSADSACTVVIFKYNDTYNTHRTITLFYDKLQQMQYGETLIVIGFPLLTHFNVGLLYLMGYSFDSIELNADSHVGLKIILKGYNCVVRIMKHLIDIQSISCHAQQEEKSIMEILPVSFLYDTTHIFTQIVDINTWMAKMYIQHAIYKILKEIQ